MPHIEAEWIGTTRIDFWQFCMKRDTKRFSDWLRFIRIDASDWSGMNRIKSDWFLSVFYETKYKTLFGLIQIKSLVKFLSDWCPAFRRNESEQLGLTFDSLSWNEIQSVFQIGYDSFGLKRNESDQVGLIFEPFF